MLPINLIVSMQNAGLIAGIHSNNVSRNKFVDHFEFGKNNLLEVNFSGGLYALYLSRTAIVLLIWYLPLN